MKEPVNTLTHFIPFILAIGALVYLILVTKTNTSKCIIMTIYGVSVVTLYGASSLYHWLKIRPRKMLILKKLDHASIYLMIAGSYTPVFFYGLTGTWKLTMLTTVWILAILGILLKIWFINIPRYLSTAFYVIFGWIALVPFIELIKNLPTGAIILMFVSGITYTIGAIIYATKWFDFYPNRLVSMKFFIFSL